MAQPEVVNDIVRGALEVRRQVVDAIEKDVGRTGMSGVSTRSARDSIRRAYKGDLTGLAEVLRLSLDNKHTDEEGEPCVVCREIEEVLRDG